ncbi:MAG: hypothetical protein LBS64_02055 [Spirochaetaceae bacterium]|jgi:hypothetical protein|nr:hypothetical protein [Spirochaetaceae bacterium]
MRGFRYCVAAFLFAPLCTLTPAKALAEVPRVHAQAILTPQDVYVGDQGVLQIDWTTAIDLLPGDGRVTIPGERFAVPQDLMSVRGAELSRNGPAYRLRIRFTPWKTGVIPFPALDVAALLTDGNSPPYPLESSLRETGLLEIAPVTIPSLAQKLMETRMRPPRPPPLIPGTTYLVFIFALAAVAASALVILCLINLNFLGRRIAAFLGSLGFSAPGRRAIRSLNVLRRKGAGLGNPECAAALEQILRYYLESRFAWPFTAAAATEMRRAFQDISAGLMDESHQEWVDKLHGLFLRCDYVRYAGQPGDTFPAAERAALTDTARGIVVFFERGGEAEHVPV